MLSSQALCKWQQIFLIYYQEQTTLHWTVIIGFKLLPCIAQNAKIVYEILLTCEKKFGKIGKNAQLKNWRQKINFLTIHITNIIKMLLFRWYLNWLTLQFSLKPAI